jgi:methyl-accepting chemotaxis protein
MIRSWSFQKKLASGFAVITGLAMVTSAIAFYALRTVVADEDRVLAVNAQNLIDAAKMGAAANGMMAAFRGYMLTADDRFLRERDLRRAELADLTRRAGQQVYTEEGKQMVAAIGRTYPDLYMSQQLALDVMKSRAGLPGATHLFTTEILPKRDVLAQQVNAFVEREQTLLEENKRMASERASKAVTAITGLAVMMALFAGLTSLLLARALARQIGGAVQHVLSSSAELQAAANQQASGAKETASAMSEMTTTMIELLASSRQITESAQRVAHIAQETATASRSGDGDVATTREAIEGIRRQVELIVGHMLDLGKKSQQIGEVLDIINEMAEQTNILAINANIEAAGAGEAGKRFAVVGEETRKLADRVSGSTREIRGLVEEIRAAVNTTVMATEGGAKATDAGLRHFDEVALKFKHITSLVLTTTEAAREIELSTKQQTTAVEQVNSAIGGTAQASRETAASSTQMLQTATELAQLSHNLAGIIQAPTRA